LKKLLNCKDGKGEQAKRRLRTTFATKVFFGFCKLKIS